MAAKVQHTVSIEGDAGEVLSTLQDMATNPSHKWIPVEEIRETNRATITGRQADWLAKRVAKKVKESSMTFVALAEPPAGEPEPA